MPLLPLSKKVSKILVAGIHANNLGYQCGGWILDYMYFSPSLLTLSLSSLPSCLNVGLAWSKLKGEEDDGMPCGEGLKVLVSSMAPKGLRKGGFS